MTASELIKQIAENKTALLNMHQKNAPIYKKRMISIGFHMPRGSDVYHREISPGVFECVEFALNNLDIPFRYYLIDEGFSSKERIRTFYDFEILTEFLEDSAKNTAITSYQIDINFDGMAVSKEFLRRKLIMLVDEELEKL